MQRTDTAYVDRKQGVVSDVETWLGNTLATIFAASAVACGVIGLMVAFDYISTTVNDPFQNGMIWMVSGLILAISGNVFRREHHIVEPKSELRR